jgi:hypothetical protein
MAIADRFANGHDIWHYTLRFKSPKMITGSATARLYLISDAQAPGSAHLRVYLREVAGR